MSEDLIKFGGLSIIIGSKYYKGYFNEKTNKLLKVCKNNINHNEMKYLSIIKKIKDYEKYYVIPDDEITIINKNDPFYGHIQKIAYNKGFDYMNGSFNCFYIDYAGEMDIIDSFDYLIDNKKSNIWKNYKSIISFTKKMIEALYFLHKNNICHLDIKPENIMIKCGKYNNFRLIDFGFSSIEPFTDYVNKVRGTPGYMPKYFSDFEPGLPQIEANDFLRINGKFPYNIDIKNIYKIDTFCLGRVVNYIKYTFDINAKLNVIDFFFSNSSSNKLDNILKILLENNVFSRKSIIEIKEKKLI